MPGSSGGGRAHGVEQGHPDAWDPGGGEVCG